MEVRQSAAAGEQGRTAKRDTLPHRVMEELLDYVAKVGLKPGDRLPTEPELCAMFQVSRTAVREAMKYLEMMGVVSLEPGRGTFLRHFDIGQFLSKLPLHLLFRPQDIVEVIRVRQSLEEACLEQAFIRGNPSDLARLGECVEAMRRRAEAGEPMDAEDVAFHRQIAQMAQARLSLMVLEVFWALRFRLPTDNSPEALWRRYHRHRRIYEALRRGDLQLARLYLMEHFAGSYEDLASFMGLAEQAESPAGTAREAAGGSQAGRA